MFLYDFSPLTWLFQMCSGTIAIPETGMLT